MKTFKDWQGGSRDRLTTVFWDGRAWDLNAEGGDVFTPDRKNDEGIFYVMSIDRLYEYVGMAVFHLVTTDDWISGADYDPEALYEPVGEVFLQNEWNIKQMIGPKGLDYADITIAKRLGHYLDETSF